MPLFHSAKERMTCLGEAFSGLCVGRGCLLRHSGPARCITQDLHVCFFYRINVGLVLWLVKVIKVYFWMDCECFSTNLLKYGNSSRLNLDIMYYYYYYYYLLFLAVLGLHCCTQAFFSCGSRGYSSLWCSGFSLRWLLLFRSTGSRRVGFISCSTRAQAAPWHVGSNRCRAWTRVPCIGRQILNHWATREARYVFLKMI